MSAESVGVEGVDCDRAYHEDHRQEDEEVHEQDTPAPRGDVISASDGVAASIDGVGELSIHGGDGVG